jgi:replication factor C small subunit
MSLFKIIILDEADEMTSDAQTSLRTIIEDSSRNTRFIIVCNYLSQVINPIQSRCVVFRFIPLTKNDVTEYLRKICERENKRFEEKALAQICEVAGGDLRYSINTLQAAAGMGNITVSNVNVAAGISGKTKVGEVLRLALAGKFNDARARLLELTQVYGMSESDFMRYANQEVYDMKIDNTGELVEIMAEYDYRLTAGAHPDIQLAAFLAQLGRIKRK